MHNNQVLEVMYNNQVFEVMYSNQVLEVMYNNQVLEKNKIIFIYLHIIIAIYVNIYNYNELFML